MDKDEASEILKNGKTNHLSNMGSLIEEPDVVLQPVFDGEDYHTTYGDFGLTVSNYELDYAIHRAKDVSLSDVDEYYALNLVEVDVFMLDDDTDEVKVWRFEATPEDWIEVER